MDDILGSNLQICFVNEHHQTSESSDNDGIVSREESLSWICLFFFPSWEKTSGNVKSKLTNPMENHEDILTKQKRLKVNETN